MAQTDLDKLIGNGEEDLHKKADVGTYKNRADDMPDDEKLPVKALPMKETPKPFNIKGA